MAFLRRVRKGLMALGNAHSRRALRFGVAATSEHKQLVRGLGPLQTVLDVGANVGQFVLLCRMVQPGAHIHAFEPISAAGKKIDALFGDDPSVTLHRCALGAETGQAKIHIAARADSSSLMPQAAQSEYFPGTREVGSESIRIARLSDEMAPDEIKRPALLKIDVQGFEGQVLKGCEDVLDRFDWIYCEASFVELYQGQPLAHEIVQWLNQRGFFMAGVEVGPGMVFDGRAVQADFLFQRKAMS